MAARAVCAIRALGTKQAMANERAKSVGGYLMRLIGGVAVILGILGIFSTLVRGNLIGTVLSVVFIVVGVFLLKRSGRAGRAGEVPSGARRMR